VDGDVAILVKNGRHVSNRRLDAVFPRLYPTHKMEGSNQPYSAVAAHPQVTDIIEKDYACSAGWI
jgi:hypothetical protein